VFGDERCVQDTLLGSGTRRIVPFSERFAHSKDCRGVTTGDDLVIPAW
jgi:hypothetical protein